MSSRLVKPLYWAAECALVAGTLAAAVPLARPAEWQPPTLVALLVVLALLGQWLSVEIRGGHFSVSVVAIVMAMGLLGPGAAAACGTAVALVHSGLGRRAPAQWLNNLVTFSTIPFVGGLFIRTLSGGAPSTHVQQLSESLTFGLIVFAGFALATALNFVLFSLDVSIEERRSFSGHVGELVALLPGELAAGGLATILAVAYAAVGMPVLIAAIVVLMIFRHLTVALVRSEDRAEQLFARSRQLVGLQLGVLRTLVRALGMRDPTTGRHSARVARYAKKLAAELGCEADEQDIIHTAGLLHDIGKFTWPDRILLAEAIAAEDMDAVRRHPQDGATLVGALDGYGAVAEAILHHHERVDGRGYPAGLIGREIPLGSRVLAVCSSFDTMTAAGGYRAAMTSDEAMQELRNGARDGQLDSEIVEAFIALLQREGPAFAQDADFETELEFDRRVREMAEPGATPSSARAPGLGGVRPSLPRVRR
jgi:putative nucleotidyltransferase with HDIG domain